METVDNRAQIHFPSAFCSSHIQNTRESGESPNAKVNLE